MDVYELRFRIRIGGSIIIGLEFYIILIDHWHCVASLSIYTTEISKRFVKYWLDVLFCWLPRHEKVMENMLIMQSKFSSVLHMWLLNK